MSKHAILVSDRAGVIQLWNDGAEELFGYTALEAIGQTLDLIVPEAQRIRHWAGFRFAMESGKTKMELPAANLPVKCRDGRVVVFGARLVFLRDAHDEAVGALAIYTSQQK